MLSSPENWGRGTTRSVVEGDIRIRNFSLPHDPRHKLALQFLRHSSGFAAMTSVFHPMSSLAPEPARREPPTFREARDLLLELDDRYVAAKTTFVWPRPETFNWALDWFDAELAAGEHGARTALKVIGETVETRTFAELSRAVVAARQRPALARREARRPAPDDARRDAGAVGDDARRDEARPRAHSGDAAARRSRHRRPDRARPGEISGRARGRRRRNSPARPPGSSASRSARRRKAGAPSPR